MKLADASRYFDRIKVLDLLTGKVLFMCQVDVYDESKRDSGTAYRRVMSVAPGTVMPASGLARIMGSVWIIGGAQTDALDELHRTKYVIEMAPTQLNVSRLPSFLSSTVTFTTYTDSAWVKDAKQLEVSSDIPQIFDVSLAIAADVRQYDVLWAAGVAYLVMSPRKMASGLQVANSLRLDQTAPVSATLRTRAYNPVTGTYSVGSTTSVSALFVRWQSLFAYGSQTSERYQEGDKAIVLPFGTVITTSSTLAYAGVTYQVLSVLDIAGAVVAHARVV
jgi:hypothetical protein